MIAKWFLIVVFYAGPQTGEPDGSRVFFGADEKECEEAREFVIASAAARKADIYAACHPVKREPQPAAKPTGDPATEQKS